MARCQRRAVVADRNDSLAPVTATLPLRVGGEVDVSGKTARVFDGAIDGARIYRTSVPLPLLHRHYALLAGSAFTATASNGHVSAVFAHPDRVSPTAADFTASVQVDDDMRVGLELKNFRNDAAIGKATFDFDPVASAARAQGVGVTVDFRSLQVPAPMFTVAAGSGFAKPSVSGLTVKGSLEGAREGHFIHPVDRARHLRAVDAGLTWADGMLTIERGGPWPSPATEIPIDGRRLLLTPSCFADGVSTMLSSRALPHIVYGARGLATLAERPAPSASRALERLLGGPRARLLTLLAEPASTTELAHRLGVSPAAVSQHLSVLRDAGLLERTRHGRHVRYRHSRLGAALFGPHRGIGPDH